MGLLGIPFVARTRRHHALEHATIHILNQRHPHTAAHRLEHAVRLLHLWTRSYGRGPTGSRRSPDSST